MCNHALVEGRAKRIVVTAVIAGLALLAHLVLAGSLWISPGGVVSALLGNAPDSLVTIVQQIRLPRALAALGVGLVLGSAGAAFQALFRNPLADPYVVGVSSGAAFGGTLAILLGLGTSLAVMSGSVAGGIATIALVLSVARTGSRIVVAGVVIASALSGLLTVNLVAAGQDSNQVLRWLLGSTTPMDYARCLTAVAAGVLGTFFLWLRSGDLNALKLGETGAERVGVAVPRTTRAVVVIAGTTVSLAVGAAGIVGFVGLAAPHIARGLVGHDERHALPASACVGATILLLADIVAQRALPFGELPLGAVTAILGAPMLFALLRASVPR